MYGNKIDNLIKMRDAGINVPAFTVVPFEEAKKDAISLEYPSSKNYFSLMFSNFVRWSLQSERQILYNLSISTVNYEKTIDL